jgi:hypothetical protein
MAVAGTWAVKLLSLYSVLWMALGRHIMLSLTPVRFLLATLFWQLNVQQKLISFHCLQTVSGVSPITRKYSTTSDYF